MSSAPVASNIMTTFPLPQELVDLIIDQFSEPTELGDLRRLSLVSRSWLPQSRRHIFRDIRLDSLPRAQAFFGLISSQFQTINFPQNPYKLIVVDRTNALLQNHWNDICQLPVTNVELVVLSYLPEAQVISPIHSSLTTLALSITRLNSVPAPTVFTFLSSFQSLAALRLYYIRWGKEVPHSNIPLPPLRSLSLAGELTQVSPLVSALTANAELDLVVPRDASAVNRVLRVSGPKLRYLTISTFTESGPLDFTFNPNLRSILILPFSNNAFYIPFPASVQHIGYIMNASVATASDLADRLCFLGDVTVHSLTFFVWGNRNNTEDAQVKLARSLSRFVPAHVGVLKVIPAFGHNRFCMSDPPLLPILLTLNGKASPQLLQNYTHPTDTWLRFQAMPSTSSYRFVLLAPQHCDSRDEPLI